MATIKKRQHARVWQLKHDQKAPKAGDPAPDFELRDIKGEDPIRLSSFHGKKPVILIFGSFT